MPASTVSWAKRLIAAACTLILITAGFPAAAQGTATIEGVVYGPDTNPAEGVRVVVRDVDSGTEYPSGPTGADGAYTISVPVGARYQVQHVTAADGSTIDVLEVPPRRITEGGAVVMDIALTQLPPAAGAAAAAAAAGDTGSEPVTTAKEKKKGLSTGAIVGIVIGSVVVAALIWSAIDDDDDEPLASPSTP